MTKITTLFLDIGGVLLTNGWDRVSRKNASSLFELDWNDFEERHQKENSRLEKGEISLDDYLERVIFWKKRAFGFEQFKEYMFEQSKIYSNMCELMAEVKAKFELRVAVVSNEGRELAQYRIKKFRLKAFVDHFIVSAFVGSQKPDAHFYHIALDVTQIPLDEIVYIDDREELIAAGRRLGLLGIHHTSYEVTKDKLLSLL